MELKPRKKKILEAIIRDYIETAEPVGSRTLSKRHDLGVSPATIRNEMSDLEEMGFLVQPHTSSGRIPTQQAYRYYVDEIMQIRKLADTVKRDIHNGYLPHAGEVAGTVKHTADVIAELTGYTAVVTAPRVSHFNCKHIQIIPLIREHILIIMVTVEGIAKNVEMNLSECIDEEEAVRISNVLNRLLKSVSFSELDVSVIEEIRELNDKESKVLREILPTIRDTLMTELTDVHTGGLSKLLSYPEFQEADQIKNLVGVMEKKQLLANVLKSSTEKNDSVGAVRVCIGDENDDENLRDFSIITTTYEVDGNTLGVFGVIGPTRMDYDQVNAVLTTLRSELNASLKERLDDRTDHENK